MKYIVPLLIIIIMVLVSKFLRQLAFGRSDSVALEIGICAFLYNLIVAVKNSESINYFVSNELLRCVILLMFPFVIAIVHYFYKNQCMKQIESNVNVLRTNMKLEKDDEKKYGRALEEVILNNTMLLTRQSIDVWYSEFADASSLRKFLPKKDSSGEKSFKKKKKLVRRGFADILNNIPAAHYLEKKLTDSDFNIENRDQIIGMIIFDVAEVLALLVAVRVF